MASFFSKLFSYKQSEARTPLEDYLTEILCELLNQFNAAGKSAVVTSELFKIDLGSNVQLEWSTQHVIQSEGIINNKRPDLVGKGISSSGEIFFIIENKIGAGFTEYDDLVNNEQVSQLDLYEDYLFNHRKETNKHIALITHFTHPPDKWRHPTILWRDLYKIIYGWYARKTYDDIPIIVFMIKNIITLLEDQEMDGTKLDLHEIVVLSAWNHLIGSSERFGSYGHQAIRKFAPKYSLGPFKVVHGNSQGEFVRPNYFGWVMTPKAIKANDSSIIIWCGALLGNAYNVICPQIATMPELNTGLGIWMDKNKYDTCKQSEIQQIVASLNNNNGSSWEIDVIPNPNANDEVVIVICCRKSYVEIYQDINNNSSKDNYWDNYVQEFLNKSFLAISTLSKDSLNFIVNMTK